MGVRAQIFWLQKAPLLCLKDLQCKCVLDGARTLPMKTWNFGLVFGKQPDAGLGGRAPVNAVPAQCRHLAQRLLARCSVKSDCH